MFHGTTQDYSTGAGEPKPARRRAAEKRSSRSIHRKARVLVVEDEIFVAWHLEAILRDLNYAVCGMVPDGEGAVRKAGECDADVILMDINLKGDIDGIEAAHRIRQTSDAPIIFITAYSDATTLSRIEQRLPGAIVLSKPVAPARLQKAIAGVLTPPDA